MSKKVINASDVGKTKYCPHSHYLSTIHTKKDKHTKERLDRGDAMHLKLDKLASQDSRCFVATYAFGENHDITCDFRAFRDAYLMNSKIGVACVTLYYKLSPKLISLFGDSNVAKAFSKGVLTLIHKSLKRLKLLG